MVDLLGIFGAVATILLFAALVVPVIIRHISHAPESSKKCYTGKDARGKMQCTKTTDDGFFPMESEDYTEAYQYQKRYGGG